MVNCGWTRLTYLLFALTILIALAQASPSADPRPLATKTPSGATVEENPPAAEGVVGEQTVQHEGATHTALLDHDEGDHRSTAIVDGAASSADPGPPLFYRPAPASPTPEQGGGVGSGPVCADLGAFPSNRTIAFPLPRKYLGSYENTWGAPRPQGGHEGTDLMAPTGTAAYALTDGTIVAVAGANENGWNSLGGYTVMLKAAYSVGPVKQGDLFYYAHLNRESALELGTRVSVGQTVGYVGDTGQGPEVTRGLFPPHLHLGWYGANSAVTSGAMNPYSLLEWIKANGGVITGGSDARYCEAPRTGGPVPSTGESRWPAPDSPGASPDLVTGMHQPAPGPATAGPGREIGHTGRAAPAQQREPAPDQSPPDAPKGTAPKTDPQTTGPSSSDSPTPPRAEPPPDSGSSGDEPPETSEGEGAEDDPDAPTSGAHPERDEVSDPPGEEQNPDEDAQGEDGGDGTEAPEEPGEEPAGEGSEDSQPPGEQTSPGEDQYAPENDRESDPETTAAEQRVTRRAARRGSSRAPRPSGWCSGRTRRRSRAGSRGAP